MESLGDTIVAPITGRGPSAVAIVRLSGPQALTITRAYLPTFEPIHAQAKFVHFPNGEEGYALPFLAPRSYTGEDTVEFMIHGSPASVEQLVRALRDLGARPAGPGEFSQQAFLNGKLDLTQAEGVRETVEAETDLQLEQANRLRAGSLRRTVAELSDQLRRVQIEVEARVDFLEEIGELDFDSTRSLLASALAGLDDLLAQVPASQMVRSGFRVAILGLPNAGKSSLFNSILQQERAIVTPQAGTTRDTIEESVDLGGYKVVLSDTAGIREANDDAEKIGVERAWTVGKQAQLVWYVYDSSLGWSKLDEELVKSLSIPCLLVANKSDLPGAPRPQSIAISTRTNSGIDQLLQRTVELIKSHGALATPVNIRHATLLAEAREATAEALAILDHNRPVDLMSVVLQQALHCLGSVTGETATPDMIDAIFSTFCIGK